MDRQTGTSDAPAQPSTPSSPTTSIPVPSPPDAGQGADGDDTAGRVPARRRRGWWALVLVPVVGAAGAVALVLARGAVEAPEAVVLPTPSPTVTAVERDRTTAFQRALPDAVLAFAVGSAQGAVDLIDRGAVEAYELGYTDGVVQVTLLAAQWPTAAEARTAAAAAWTGGLPALTPPPSTPPGPEEPVLVAGEEVGRVVVAGDGTSARAVWTNGATLFVVDGPDGVVGPFFDAFPM